MTTIQSARLHYNEQGTPVSDVFDDVYFSNDSGLHETLYVFVTQNGLPERFQTHTRRQFHVMETGFGTGLNFLVLWREFLTSLEQAPHRICQQLHFSTFEKFPLSHADLQQALRQWPELAWYSEQLLAQYPKVFLPGCQRLRFSNGQITLDLWLGDVHDNLPLVSAQNKVDAWFLDGFAPSKNPDMWQDTLWRGMARLSDAGTTVATFTSAGIVRRGIASAGFVVKKIKGFGKKREMAVACMATPDGQLLHHWPFPTAHSGDEAAFSSAPEPIAFDALPMSEVTIVGGGLASLLLASSLIERGARVHLLCADPSVGHGASHNRQGALYPQLQYRMTPSSQLHLHAFVFAQRRYRELFERLDVAHDFCGVLQLACNEQLIQRQAKIRACAEFPAGLWQAVDAKDASDIAGLTVPFSGFYFPDGGWIAPQQLCQQLLFNLQSNSSFRVDLNCQVQGMSHDNADGWRLQTSAGDVMAQQLVLCVGHQLAQWPQAAHLPMSQVRGQVSHVKANGLASLRTVLCHQGYITPYDQVRDIDEACVGASFDRDCALPVLKPADDVFNLELVQQVFSKPQWFADATVQSAKAGVRSTVRDHLPVVGRLAPQLYVLGGLGARGLLFAPLLAEQLAAQICMQAQPLSQPLASLVDVARFASLLPTAAKTHCASL